jgi:acyl-CoA thioester hydrolase
MFSESFPVRFYETDALGHVSNTVLACWYETAREPFFRMFNPELDLANWPLILASYNIDFLEQIFYGKEVEVRSSISKLGRSSFQIYQEVWQNDKKCASGTTTLVHFDYKQQKSAPIPDDVRQQLQAHMLEH